MINDVAIPNLVLIIISYDASEKYCCFISFL